VKLIPIGKKMRNIRNIAFVFFVFLTMRSYSQDLFSTELKWEYSDSTTTIAFEDTIKIREWGEKQFSFSSIYIKDILNKGNRYYVMMVDVCSGLYCGSIYVFKLCDSLWRLRADTKFRSAELIEINVNSELGEIIFKTKSGQIGEVQFEALN
jgi:hypothetical protein